jgi:putative ATPase
VFKPSARYRPLADRMRPRCLDDYAGQQHLLALGKPLREAIEKDHLHSMLFWGAPGTGKTTLANLISHYCDAEFISLSAVFSGVKDIRQAVIKAKATHDTLGQSTILFVDEVHRFNKAQQDAFLPYIEDGTFFFIGATTENPSFELNNALLSRVRIYVLKLLSDDELEGIIQRAIADKKQGLGSNNIVLNEDALNLLVRSADGDARRALNWLEIATDLTEVDELTQQVLTVEHIANVAQASMRRFDKKGDLFYEQISALHKSVRGSKPDAALYWFCRMIEAGCDPLYIARRVIRIASEDIGNADPRALTLALNAWEAYERLGSPEGELIIAQALIYLSCAPKSNAVYKAYKAAVKASKNASSADDVPLHLRNAPTTLMQDLSYGHAYRYAHDEENAYAAGETYFPDSIGEQRYYFPVERGLEVKIQQKLAWLRSLDKK